MGFELIIILLGIIGAIFWNRTTKIGRELIDFHHSFKEGQNSGNTPPKNENYSDDFELNDITGMHNMN